MSRIFSQAWNNYELIDAGGNKKLERWGNFVTIRPDRNAYFSPVLNEKEWHSKAHFEFVEENKSKGYWKVLKINTPQDWIINYNSVRFNLQLTKYKHIGLFPEQQLNWEFLENNIKGGDRLLNLFGYTGAASVVAREKGADVFHCDSVKQVINWAKTNMEMSNLSDIHWVLEDAIKFAQRELKRGRSYDGIIMDPPAFGIGAKKERWKIEDRFHELLSIALGLKNKNGFIIANTYSPRLEIDEITKIAQSLCSRESVEVGTLSIMSTTKKILEYGQRTLIR